MAYQTLEACTIPIDGQPKRAVKATCGQCQKTETLPFNTSRSHGNDDEQVERQAKHKFENIGWSMGKTAAQHRCPKCFTTIRRRKEDMKKSTSDAVEVSNKIVQMVQPEIGTEIMTKNMTVTQEPEAPKRPTRDEKRIIFQTIDGVYVGEKTGYSEGWNDKRIASDLGVPVIWVSTIREENFGPDIDQAMATLINEAKAILIEMKATQLTAEPVLALLKEISERADRIEHRLRIATNGN